MKNISSFIHPSPLCIQGLTERMSKIRGLQDIDFHIVLGKTKYSRFLGTHCLGACAFWHRFTVKYSLNIKENLQHKCLIRE